MATIMGTKSINLLNGTSSDDLFAGLAGNDTISGGGGTDTAWYSGLLRDYNIGTSGAYLAVTDRNKADGDDGTDSLSSIERLAFSDASLQVTGGEFQVNTCTASDQSNPSVTALADGGFVVTWESYLQDGSSYGVYGQRYDAQGVKAGSEFKVNTCTTYEQYNSSVTALSDGGFMVTWQSYGQDGSGYGIYGQRYDTNGVKVGSEFLVNTYTTYNQENSSVTDLADGGFVVTWKSYLQDGSYLGVYGQRYNANGVKAGSEFQINTYTTGNQEDNCVTALSDGGFVVVWKSAGQDSGSNDGIYGQRYDANGVKVGSEFHVNTYTANGQWCPSVTAMAGGGFVVTWQSDGQDGSNFGIYGQRYDINGVAAGGEFLVNTYTASSQEMPSVTALTDGGFVVTWRSSGQDGSSWGIYGQRYDADGVKAGCEFQINTYTSSDQSNPSVTALDDGGFVVTWSSSLGQDGSGYGVYGQRYDAQGNPVGFKVTGTAAADTLNIGEQNLLTVDGAAGNDTINGGTRNDILLGGTGNDKLTGGEGDDYLDGGIGNDTMIGGNGSDTYVIDSSLDVITETGTSGSDTVMSSLSYTLGATLENLTLTGTGNINGTGNASGNLLVGNTGDNILDGKAGGDLMIGSTGNDTYIVDSLFDLVSENPDQGTDKVISSVDHTLGDNLEELLLNGTAINGTGNTLANIIDGNALANFLSGGAENDTLRGQAGKDNLDGGTGNDYLVGGLGNDTLTGGAGTDTFRFDAALGVANVDHITDFSHADDTIALSMAIFSKLGGPGSMSAGVFASGTSFLATDSHYLLYNTATGGLYYNADGAGTGAPLLIAVLDNTPSNVDATDFTMV